MRRHKAVSEWEEAETSPLTPGVAPPTRAPFRAKLATEDASAALNALGSPLAARTGSASAPASVSGVPRQTAERPTRSGSPAASPSIRPWTFSINVSRPRVLLAIRNTPFDKLTAIERRQRRRGARNSAGPSRRANIGPSRSMDIVGATRKTRAGGEAPVRKPGKGQVESRFRRRHQIGAERVVELRVDDPQIRPGENAEGHCLRRPPDQRRRRAGCGVQPLATRTGDNGQRTNPAATAAATTIAHAAARRLLIRLRRRGTRPCCSFGLIPPNGAQGKTAPATQWRQNPPKARAGTAMLATASAMMPRPTATRALGVRASRRKLETPSAAAVTDGSVPRPKPAITAPPRSALPESIA